MKRIFDFTASLLLLIILSPVFLLICLLILIDSGFPVIFRQYRVGRDNKPVSYTHLTLPTMAVV